MKKKFFNKETLQGVGHVVSHLAIAFVGQLGALIAVDYYYSLKDEIKSKNPIGFRMDD